MIICPKCKNKAKSINTRCGIRNSCCDLWSWDNAPLVDEETHEARKAAHIAFDVLWKYDYISRKSAYKMLAEILDIPYNDCHMKLMDADTAKKVIKATETLKKLVNYEK